VSTYSGDGWAVLDTTCYAGKPGAYDIGARLGVTTSRILLVILRAAERWAPDGALPVSAAIVPRRGRVLVQFADGSTALHDADTRNQPSKRPPTAVVNVDTELAELLVITTM
jgi:hypothetical protein